MTMVMEWKSMKSNRYHTIPLEAQYLYQRGLEMVRQRKEPDALIFFRQAVFIAPDFLKAYHEPGNCLARLDRQEEAVAYYAKALRDSYQDGNTTMLVSA